MSTRLPCLLAAGLGAALLVADAPARADGDPDLDWWTIHTEHFNIHYARSYEPVAERVAKLAESIHRRMKDVLGYSPKSATEIVLTDDTDLANGSATAIPYNTIRLFVTAPDDISPLADIDDWYLELVTHEYTHILHTDNISGVPAIINAVIGKSYSPNQVQPRWILEGLAVVEESQHTSGGRLRSSAWNMFLRADVLENNIATLDQVSSGAYRWPGANIWYLYGSRFLGWITEIYGPNTMRAVSADYGASLVPWGLNRAIRRATGRTYEELYEGFKDEIAREYKQQKREVEERGLREGTRVTFHGREVHYPRFVPRAARESAAEQIDYFRDDSDDRAGIYQIPLAAPPAASTRDEELVARTTTTSNATWAPDGSMTFNSIAVYKNLYPRNDLFTIPRGKRSESGEESYRKRLTVGLRSIAPDLAPDGKKVVFTVNNKGTTYLEIADVGPDGAIGGRRDLVPSGRFDQAYTPRFSHDGKKVAYSSWTAGGYRDVRIVDVASGAFVEVTHDRSLDVDPFFSPDDKTLYFCSDRTGIFNVYAYDVEKKTLKQVTNVVNGAFQPDVDETGRTLVYVGYTKDGFDLYTMPIDPSRFLDAVDPPGDRPDPPAEPVEVPRTKKRYNALSTILPRRYLFEYKPGSYGANALTVKAQSSDVVGLHTISLSLIADPRAPTPQIVADYSYDRLPFDFGARFFHTVVPRTGYRVNNENLGYDEYNTGVTTGVSYDERGEFSNQSFGLSLSLAHFKGDLPVSRFLDPYNTTTINPPEGDLDVLHFGYGYSNIEGSLDAAGAPRGFAFGFGIDYGAPIVASGYSVRAIEGSLNVYFEMPWPGHHTLALRAAGAASAGEYPRGASYSVGGYDLDNNSFASTVLSGVFNGAFVLRGYPPSVYSGSEYLLQNIEYRVPLWIVDHGYSTLPVYLRRIDLNGFIDYGGAFDKLDIHNIEFFRDGNFLDAPQLHTSAGAEIWLSFVLGYGLATQLRLGFAHGYSADALQPGQFYFVASSAY